MIAEFKGAFEHCSWCGGRGCNQCTYEREKYIKANYDENGYPKPMAVFKTDDPNDMKLAKQCIGKEALEHAFGPYGDGVLEIERNCAIASLIRVLRKQGPKENSEDQAKK